MKRILSVLLLSILVLTGCAAEEKTVDKVFFAMNTVMDIKVWGTDAEAAAGQVAALCNDLERTWSASDETSLLSQMNAGKSVQLDQEQEALLKRVEELSERTRGAFDPKLHAVSVLWSFTGENPRVPGQEEIEKALLLDHWDMGASLKGYAGQQAAELLESMDVDRATINLGGNIQTYGEKSDGSPWSIGVQNPEGGDYLGILSVTGTASIVTSGDYQRYFEENGVKYHHILDPETGCPADSGLRSVTVICRDGLTADCLSTALFVMGLERGTDFWRASDDFEAVFITSDNQIYATEGANLSGCEYEVISR